MIVHPFPQGSPAWLAARCGKITASATERYFAPDARRLRRNKAGDGLAVGAVTYLYELLAEWYFGAPYDIGSTGYMQRGSRMETDARAAYELHTMSDVRQCGFIESDCGRFGCSVDGLVGENGLVEIKVLSGREHLRLWHEGSERAYAQVQAQLLDTERAWCDRFFYHPDRLLWVDPVRTERDDDFIESLREARTIVSDELHALQLVHLNLGFKPPQFCRADWTDAGERSYSDAEFYEKVAALERKRQAHVAHVANATQAALETFR